MGFFQEISEYQGFLSGDDYEELSKERESELALSIADGDEAALDTLVKSRMKYAIKRAVQLFSGYRIDSSDLISCANIALVKAARRYAPSYGTKFTTYYDYWLHNECYNFMNKNHPVKIPKSITSKKEKLKALNIQSVSIDQTKSGHDSDTEYNILDVLGISEQPSEELEVHQCLLKAFLPLDELETFVIISRFFFDKTLREVAEEIGDITHQGVSVVENRALKKMNGAVT